MAWRDLYDFIHMRLLSFNQNVASEPCTKELASKMLLHYWKAVYPTTTSLNDASNTIYFTKSASAGPALAVVCSQCYEPIEPICLARLTLQGSSVILQLLSENRECTITTLCWLIHSKNKESSKQLFTDIHIRFGFILLFLHSIICRDF